MQGKRLGMPIWALAAGLAVGGSVGGAVGWRAGAPRVAFAGAWTGRVVQIAHSGAGEGVVQIGGASLARGQTFGPGAELHTDARTRARLEMSDGSVLIVDRATRLRFGPRAGARDAQLEDGVVMADVAHVDGAAPVVFTTAQGAVRVVGTRLALTAVDGRTDVEVLRGRVAVSRAGASPVDVSAGQEAVVSASGVDMAPANDLAQRVAFAQELGFAPEHNDDADQPAGAVGELLARRPGKTDEKDRKLRLEKHAVKVRIAGAVARTEIDETFANDTGDVLEGIYRFPLPPGAQIERLGLEVNGKLEEGAFADKSRAAAIFRGAVFHATPHAPRPREDIVWVPGPWRDPALLEWKRAGRFELKIFPIPKHGTRRVVIAYTETVPLAAGRRRFVLPLPSGGDAIGTFSVDAQVVGHDADAGVKVRGYEMTQEHAAGAEKLRMTASAFVPSGDMTIDYALPNARSELTAWAYELAPPPAAPKKAAPAKATPARADADAAPALGPDRFLALALRPQLPGWMESRPRDYVLVVDSGRAMFGEREKRASRLAVQVAQEMDRRDRVTVLACDTTCRQNAGGFLAAGSPAAHDIDAFLASVTPDGASDLVGAVTQAARLATRPDRDVRVVLLSAGDASAGYKRASRIAAEVADGLDARAQVVAVPVGSDADTVTLGEIARGGGGVVVPYAPGETLETAALDVLSATFGRALRDVSITLPSGLADVAPAQPPAIRPGSETFVVARMLEPQVRGDVVVRGTLGGEPFEKRYPVDVTASHDAGNAFVPRLFAAARIADLTRTAGDDAKKEATTLSTRLGVPSPYTSLLVLESDAMYHAFGITRGGVASEWTGEQAATASLELTAAVDETTSDAEEGKDADDDLSTGLLARAEGAATGAGGGGASMGDAMRGFDREEPRSTQAHARPMSKVSSTPPPAAAPTATTSGALALEAPPRDRWRRPPFGGGRLMKRVWHREGSIAAPATPDVAQKIVAARAAVTASPDDRAKYRELARLLATTGQLDELGDVLTQWTKRDPLDPEATAARADLLAMRGDREAALRVVGGAAIAGDPATLDRLAEVAERDAVPDVACAFRVAAAESRPADVTRVARAVRCERARGRTGAAHRWLDEAGARRAAIEKAVDRQDAAPAPRAAFGDLVVDATWREPGIDLDLAVFDPAGKRLGWLGLDRTRVTDPTAIGHERFALSTGKAGSFFVEVARANGGTAPVSGTLTISAFGTRRAIPFTLTGSSATVARVDGRWRSELVPLDTEQLQPFDGPGVGVRLRALPFARCTRQEGPFGSGRLAVRYDPSGRVTAVSLTQGLFAGTAEGRCITGLARGVTVAPFRGSSASISVPFVIAP